MKEYSEDWEIKKIENDIEDIFNIKDSSDNKISLKNLEENDKGAFSYIKDKKMNYDRDKLNELMLKAKKRFTRSISNCFSALLFIFLFILFFQMRSKGVLSDIILISVVASVFYNILLSLINIFGSISSYFSANKIAKKMGADVKSRYWILLLAFAIFGSTLLGYIGVPLLASQMKLKIDEFLIENNIKPLDL